MLRANDNCWCGSGKKYKRCHKMQLLHAGVVAPELPVPPEIERPDYYESYRPVRNREAMVKAPDVIERMRKACHIAHDILDEVGAAVAPGVTTDEIDRISHEAHVSRGVYPSPLRYNHFPKSLCTSVNEVICHGIPDDRALADGDIVNLDITVYIGGVHGDTNATFGVGRLDPHSAKLVRVTSECLDHAIDVPIVHSRSRRDFGTCIALLSAGLLVAITTTAIFIALDRNYSAQQDELERIAGVVETVEEEGGESYSGTIGVLFVEGGTQRHAVVDVDDAREYFAGSSITVLVDPADRTAVTVPGENYLPSGLRALWIVAIAGGFAAMISSVWLVSLLRQRRSLRSHDWQRRIVRSCRVGRGDTQGLLLFVEEPEGGMSTYRVSGRSWRLPVDCVWRADVAGGQPSVFRPVESDKLTAANRFRNRPLRSGTPMTNVGSEAGDDGTAVALACDDDFAVYHVGDAFLREPQDADCLVQAASIEVVHLEGEYAVLRVSDGDTWLFARVVPEREARKRWPALVH